MAEEAVSCELFSAQFPPNREYCTFSHNPREINSYQGVLWREKLHSCDESEQASNRE